MDSVCICVATHKKQHYELPASHKWIQVGCELQGEKWEGYIHDNDGENISGKNSSYSELTALYWMWKNSDADICGICHYRRYFSSNTMDTMVPFVHTDEKHLKKDCISPEKIRQFFSTGKEIILVKPYIPYPKTALEELSLFCYQKDIEAMKTVIGEEYPEYAAALEEVLADGHISYYNMMIAPRRIFDSYCEWIFDVLGRIEKRCDISGYDKQHKRLYGYLSEVLLNVYVRRNRLKVQYVKTVYMDETASPKERFSFYCKRALSGIHDFLRKIKCYFLAEAVYKIAAPGVHERFNHFLMHHKESVSG